MYKVVRQTGCPPTPHLEDSRKSDALHIANEYGIGGLFTLEQIVLIWEEYSESMAAGWINPDKESIEQVFRVQLEEL